MPVAVSRVLTLERPEALFRSRWLREQLWGLSGLLTRGGDGRRYVAAPYDAGRPFPLPALLYGCSRRHAG